jgi:hypothetical protein
VNTAIEYWPDVWIGPVIPQRFRDRSVWFKTQLFDLDKRAAHGAFDTCDHGQTKWVWLDQPHLWLCLDCSRPPRSHASPRGYATCQRCLLVTEGIDLITFQAGMLLVTGDLRTAHLRRVVPLWARTELCEECVWSELEGV